MKRMKGSVHIEQATAVAASTALVGVSLVDRLNAFIVPFLGVPVTVLTMAAAGAGVSFIHGDPESNHKRMFKHIVGNTFLAVLLVAVVPKMFSMAWVEPGIAPPIAALIAWASRWGVPAMIKLMPDVVKKVFRLKEYNESSSFDGWGSSSRKHRYYDEDTKE